MLRLGMNATATTPGVLQPLHRQMSRQLRWFLAYPAGTPTNTPPC